MGYDVMRAWAQTDFEFSGHIQRGKEYSKQFSFDSVETHLEAHPDFSNHHYTAQQESEIPSLNSAKTKWSPTKSLHIDSVHEIPRVETPQSIQQSCPPASASRSTSPIQSQQEQTDSSAPLSLQDRHSLPSKLFVAACTGDLKQIETILNQGTSIDHPSTVEGLYEAFKPPKSGSLSPLAGAAGSHQLPSVRLLLSHGAEINPDVRLSSSSPLLQACRADDVETARFLLANGAEVDKPNSYLSTPLMYAVKYGSPELVRLILEHKPDIHVQSFISVSAIHWATWWACRESLELVLLAGADPDQPTGDGSAPLHCAAMVGGRNIAECLLAHGADPRVKNDIRETPAEVAEKNGFGKLAQRLREAEATFTKRT